MLPGRSKDEREPQYMQLYAHIKEEIQAGRLADKTRLPSVRKLADMLGISTTPVEMAYQQLLAEGFIQSRPRSGYYVQELPDADWKQHAESARPQETGIMRRPMRDGRLYEYDFHMSQNDFSLFPYTLWRRLYNQTLRQEQEAELFYGDPQGERGLREQICKYLHSYRGVVCSPDQIVVGADQFGLLSLLALMLKHEHGRIGVENPGYLLFANTFAAHGYETVPIPLEDDGIDIQELYQSQVRLVTVSPSHQYPQGMIMPISKRLQLLEWAQSVNGYIIEDDYDGEFRYHGKPIPSLQGLRPQSNVIYMGGFAQVMAPALCVWYMVLPECMLETYCRLLQETLLEQSASRLHQQTLQVFMEQGHLERHVRKMRNLYRKKHDGLVTAVQEYFGDRAKIIGQNAGFHVLLRVNSPLGEQELIERARAAGIRASSASFTWLRPPREMHKEFFLGFAGIPLDKIKPGIKALRVAWFGKD